PLSEGSQFRVSVLTHQLKVPPGSGLSEAGCCWGGGAGAAQAAVRTIAGTSKRINRMVASFGRVGAGYRGGPVLVIAGGRVGPAPSSCDSLRRRGRLSYTRSSQLRRVAPN